MQAEMADVPEVNIRDVFAFLQVAEHTEPEVFEVEDEVTCVSKSLEFLKAAAKPIEGQHVQVVTRALDFFLMKDRSRAFKSMPTLPVLPAKITNSENPSKRVRTIVNEHYAKIEKIVSHAVLDGLHDTNVLWESECAGCDGFCAVQRAHFTSQFYESERHFLVPCISEKTRNLPLYEYSDYHLVSMRSLLTF